MSACVDGSRLLHRCSRRSLLEGRILRLHRQSTSSCIKTTLNRRPATTAVILAASITGAIAHGLCRCDHAQLDPRFGKTRSPCRRASGQTKVRPVVDGICQQLEAGIQDIHIHMHIHIHIHMICICICIYIYIDVHIHLDLGIYVYRYMFVDLCCMCLYMYTCIYVSMCRCTDA